MTDSQPDTRPGRRTADGAPVTSGVLSANHRALFERTVGDEIQGVLSTADAVTRSIVTLTNVGRWRIGVGVGSVVRPLPRSTRAASGPAFLAAREAIEAARTSPVDLAVRVAPGDRTGEVGGELYADAQRSAHLAEGVLWLAVSAMRRRTDEGWEVVEVMNSKHTGRATAAALGISPSAVSQRLSRASHGEVQRGLEVAAKLLTAADLDTRDGTSS
jgi:hypothetical protein